jgi:hypothetical protein
MRPKTLSLALLALTLASITVPSANAARANLPTANEVKPSKKMRIDGEYRISTLNKRVLVDRGRAIVLEGWKHMLLWDVEPGMVVVRDIKHVGNGQFTGRDLPLNADWRAQHNKANRSLSVVATGPMGATRYELVPVDAAYEDDEEPPVPVATSVKAKRMGNAVLPVVSSCPGKQSYLSNGACWTCSGGYKRAKLTREMDHPKACVKRGSWGKGPFKSAKRQNIAGARCPSGQFHIAEKGVNGCYRCPTGYSRDRSTRNSAMCMSRQG